MKNKKLCPLARVCVIVPFIHRLKTRPTFAAALSLTSAKSSLSNVGGKGGGREILHHHVNHQLVMFICYLQSHHTFTGALSHERRKESLLPLCVCVCECVFMLGQIFNIFSLSPNAQIVTRHAVLLLSLFFC